MAITSAKQTEILKIVAGLFNSAPGGTYLTELANLVQGGMTTSQLANALAAHSLFTGTIMAGKVTTSSQVAVLMKNFGLVADSTTTSAGSQAQAYFTQQIDAGVGFGKIVHDAVQFLSGSVPSEFTTAANLLTNKALVAATYSESNSSTSLSALQNVLSNVTGATVYTATDVTNILAGSGSSTGTTFTLTTASDAITGTSGNDTIRGSVTFDTDGAASTSSTYTVSDSVSAGLGQDTLDLIVDGGSGVTDAINMPIASVTGVEVVSLRNVVSSTDASVVFNGSGTGATLYQNDRSTNAVKFDNIGTADVTIKGDSASTLGATTIDTGTSATTDAFVLNLSGGTKGTGAIDVSDTDAQWTSATINSTGASNEAGAVTIGGSKVKDLAINASSALSASSLAGFDATTGVVNKITISGAAAATSTNTGVSIGTLADAVDEVNASGLTAGGLTMTLSSTDGVTALKVTGGAGQDKITTSGLALTSAASIDAGAGTSDRLIVTASTHIDATLGKLYKGFEELEVSNSTGTVSVDLSQLTDGNTVSSVRINSVTTDGTDSTAVSNLTAIQAGAVTIAGYAATTDGTVTVGVKNATEVGQADTVKIKFDDDSSTEHTISVTNTDGGLVLAGVENLVLDASADKASIVLGSDAAALTSLSLTGSKDITVSYTAALAVTTTNTSINGSDATGILSIDNSLTSDSTAAIAITGGSKGDTIKFWADDATDASDAVASVVNGGAGMDSISAIVGAAATDAVGITTAFKIVSDAISSANADLIKVVDNTTDATSVTTVTDGGTDSTWSYKYTGALTNGTGTSGDGIASGEIVTSTDATLASALADSGAANAVIFRITGLGIETDAGSSTAVSTLMTTFTEANASALVSKLIGTASNALNGTITSLDSVLSTSDSALVIIDEGTNSVVLRITNTDTSTANTLTTAEVQVVGVVNADNFGAGGALGTLTWS